MAEERTSAIAGVPGAPRLPLELAPIRHGDRIFSLTKPVSVTVELEKRVWVLQCEALRILAYGESRDEALASFCEDFADLYDHIAVASDDELAADAQELKARMLGLVAAVRT